MPAGRAFNAFRQKSVETSLSFTNMPSTIIPLFNQSAPTRRILSTTTLASRFVLALRNETNPLPSTLISPTENRTMAESLQQTSPQLQRSFSAGLAQGIILNGMFTGNGDCGDISNNDANEVFEYFLTHKKLNSLVINLNHL